LEKVARRVVDQAAKCGFEVERFHVIRDVKPSRESAVVR
jgi:hypothetical protein